MLRATVAVFVGYLAMVLAVFAIFVLSFTAIGQSLAFEPGSYAVTWMWVVPAIIVSVIAAMFGGYACARISPGRAPQVLAGIVLVLGLVLALPALNPISDPRPTVRAPGVSNMEAMANAHQPVAISLLTPLIGTIGTLLGARRARK